MDIHLNKATSVLLFSVKILNQTDGDTLFYLGYFACY